MGHTKHRKGQQGITEETTKERGVNKIHTDNKQTLAPILTILNFPCVPLRCLLVPPFYKQRDNANLKSKKKQCNNIISYEFLWIRSTYEYI